MSSSPQKPQPIVQPESEKYWDGLKNEEIWLQRSKKTGEFQFFPRGISIYDPSAGEAGVEWVKASGKATLFTFAIVHAAPHPGFVGDLPYITALVELEEGVKIPTNIVGIEPEPENFQIGMELVPVFEHHDGQATLLKFRPA